MNNLPDHILYSRKLFVNFLETEDLTPVNTHYQKTINKLATFNGVGRGRTLPSLDASQAAHIDFILISQRWKNIYRLRHCRRPQIVELTPLCLLAGELGLCSRAGGNRWPEGGGRAKMGTPFFSKFHGENRQTRCINAPQSIDTPSPEQLGLYSRAGGNRWPAREEQQVARGGGVQKSVCPFFQSSTGENRQTRCINAPQNIDTPSPGSDLYVMHGGI